MYLFFILHKKGIDVNSVYEAELKDIPTNRFNDWMKKQMDEDDMPPDISFESQASYEPIQEGPMPQPVRPNWVPKLKLDTIPDYITSSDEDDNESVNGSKIQRKSELISETSLSVYSKEPIHTRFKEDYSLSKEKHRKNFVKERIPDDSNMSSFDMNKRNKSISQSINHHVINLNL